MAKKVQKLALLDTSFTDLFCEVEIWYYKNFKIILGHFLER